MTLRELSDFKGQAFVDGVLELVERLKPLHLSIVGGNPLVRYRILRLTGSASKYDLSFGSDFPFIPDEMILRVAETYTELNQKTTTSKSDRA